MLCSWKVQQSYEQVIINNQQLIAKISVMSIIVINIIIHQIFSLARNWSTRINSCD